MKTIENEFKYIYKSNEYCTCITIMNKNKKAFISLEIFNDNNYSYLSDLLVEKSYRNKGLGSSILKEAERITKLLGKDSTQLIVLNNTWMKDWYKRVGYNCSDSNENFCYMIKTL